MYSLKIGFTHRHECNVHCVLPRIISTFHNYFFVCKLFSRMKLSIDCPKSGYDKVEDIDLASWNDLIEMNQSHLENIESEAKQLIKDKMDKFSG